MPTLTDGVTAGFTTVVSGENLPVSARTQVFCLTQVHSRRLVVVGPGDEPAALARTQADGLLTVRPDACLTIRVADCVPVLLAAPEGRGVAAVHAGWRGLAARILAAAVGKLCELASVTPSDLTAAAGPAIGPCCYEVEREVGERIASPSPAGVLGPVYGDDRVRADVHRAAVNQLCDAGLEERRVETLRICTRCHPWLLHSYRRNGPRAGRQLGFILGSTD